VAAVRFADGRHASGRSYPWIWSSVRPIVPAVTLAGCVLLLRSGSVRRRKQSEILLLVAMAAMMSLVQYPYSFGIYFYYVAPLVALALLYVATAQSGAPLPSKRSTRDTFEWSC